MVAVVVDVFDVFVKTLWRIANFGRLSNPSSLHEIAFDDVLETVRKQWCLHASDVLDVLVPVLVCR